MSAWAGSVAYQQEPQADWSRTYPADGVRTVGIWIEQTLAMTGHLGKAVRASKPSASSSVAAKPSISSITGHW